MDSTIKYSTIRSLSLSECFTDIKSVCIVTSIYATTALCVRAKDTSLDLHTYGKPSLEYKYYYVPCDKFGVPTVGTVITPELYNSITILEKAAKEDDEELVRFYKVKFQSKINY